MRKKAYIFIVIVTVLISKNINAQDKIFLKSGDKIEAKIIEVNIDNLKYKKISNQNGPVFTIPKKDIHMVEYENGESDIFKEKTIEFKRNRINLDVLVYMYNGPLSISYERLNESGKIGYEIPINLHMNEGEYVGLTTGLNIKYYVSGSAKGFYVGPTLALGAFDYYYEDGDYYFDYDTVFSVVPGAKLGYQYQLSNLFGLSLGGTVGYIIPFEGNYQGDIAYSINFGLNFSLEKKLNTIIK